MLDTQKVYLFIYLFKKNIFNTHLQAFFNYLKFDDFLQNLAKLVEFRLEIFEFPPKEKSKKRVLFFIFPK
jgi:hypothetical protein